MIGTSEITVRPAAKKDTIAIADVLRNEGLSLPPAANVQLVTDHWERLWDKNPYYQELDADVFYGWVMEQDEKIVGFFGYLPRVYFLNQKKITVYIASNWGVLKPYRRFTYLLCNAFFNSFPQQLKLTTTAITPTGKIFTMFKGKKFPDAELNQAYVIPFKLEKLLRIKLSTAPVLYTIAKPFLQLLNFIMPVAFQCRFFWKKQVVQQINSEELPADFEEFWQSYLQQSNGLLASRSLQTMQWVYADVKKENRKRIFLYRSKESNQILGYASLILEPVVTSPDMKRYKIGDLLALNEQVKKEIIQQLISYSFFDGADLLEVHLVSTLTRNEIPSINFVRTTPAFPVYYHTADKELEQLLSKKENWHFTPYDGDTILG